MAQVIGLNPRRKKRAKRSRAKKRGGLLNLFKRKRRRSRRRATRKNPVRALALRDNPRRRRRRNPFGLGKLMPSSGIVRTVVAAAGGFFGAKALDYFNRDWTYNATTNVTLREFIKDGAATGAAIAASAVAKATGLAKGSGANDVLMGGLLYALNRGITARGKAQSLTGFSAHMLGDYVDADGGDNFNSSIDSDLGHYGVPGSFLEDYVLMDGDLGDDDLDDGDLEDYMLEEEF